MIDQDLQPKDLDHMENPPLRRIEPDWTESEWFQVWLQLARHPYHYSGGTATEETPSGTQTR
jgi:hypothetical protein